MKKENNSHLSDKEKNMILGTPFPEDVKEVKRTLKAKVKSLLPHLPKPIYNGLPEGFM